MKTTSVIIAFIVSFGAMAQEKLDFSLASVGVQIYGVYVFVGSTPAQEYIYVATIEDKIDWSAKTKEDRFRDIIHTAKKKYTDFNGLIVHDENMNKVDLIRFKELQVSRGGIELRSKVTFVDRKNVYYGEVIELGAKKQGKDNEQGTVKYLNVFGEEKIEKLKYTDMTPLSDTEYEQRINEFKSVTIARYTYQIDEKVSWVKGKDGYFGKVMALDDKSHNATVSYVDDYGDEINIKMGYLDLEKLEESSYSRLLQEHMDKVKLHQFKVGDKVTWVQSNILKKETIHLQGEIVALDNATHKASVKYLDGEGIEQIAKVDYLELNGVK